MKKMFGNATWNTFTPEQKETIEEWFFIHNLTYRKVQQRCAEKFGLQWSLSAMVRTRRHLAAMRAIAEAVSVEEDAAKLDASGCKAEILRPSLMKIATTRLLQTAMINEDIPNVGIYARVLMQGEARDLQRDRLAFAIRKHEFNASQAALKALPLLDEFTLDDEEREKARIAAVRRILFGPPDTEQTPAPENQKEGQP